MAKTQTKKTESYSLVISLGNEVLQGSGDTVLEALRSITPPVKIFTKGLIKLVKGEKKMEQTWIPARVKRLFYPLAQPVLSKQLEYLLK
jgi:hypothetical protein